MEVSMFLSSCSEFVQLRVPAL